MNYEDIIHHPHHVSPRHPQMPMRNRAAQFAPFAALTGHSASMEETARFTEEEITLSSDYMEELNHKLGILRKHLPDHPEITVTFFQSDHRKAGGEYKTLSGRVKKLDRYKQTLELEDGTVIPVNDLVDIAEI